MSIASWTSPPASARTFPISCVMRSVSSALWSTTSCAKRKRISPRFGAGTRRQSSYAAFAAATARSTSAAAGAREDADRARRRRGSWTRTSRPRRRPTHSPPMKFCCVRVPVVAMRASLPPQSSVMTASYLDPRDAEYAASLPPTSATRSSRPSRASGDRIGFVSAMRCHRWSSSVSRMARRYHSDRSPRAKCRWFLSSAASPDRPFVAGLATSRRCIARTESEPRRSSSTSQRRTRRTAGSSRRTSTKGCSSRTTPRSRSASRPRARA